MRRLLNLEEFAQQLRLEGNEFADDILELVYLEEEVVEPYNGLCEEIAWAADGYSDPRDASRALGWLADRSQELDKIHALFSEQELIEGNAPDMISERFEELKNVEEILSRHGGWTEGDLQNALFALIDRANKLSNDLEYDL